MSPVGIIIAYCRARRARFERCSTMIARQYPWAAFGQHSSSALRAGRNVELESLSSEALMDRYAAGDERAFDLLYSRFANQLFGHLLRLCGNRDRAEDLLQTTFEKAHRSRLSHVTGSPVAPWLFAIARNAFYDERRRQNARPEALDREGALPEPCTPDSNPVAEVLGFLGQALARLPSTYRDAFVLTKCFGHSGAEAAASLDITPANLKARVHRASRTLREFALAGL